MSTEGDPSSQSGVKVFSSDTLNTLLIGKQPFIGTHRHLRPQQHQVHRDGIDFSKYPFPDEIIPSSTFPSVNKTHSDRSPDIPIARQPSVQYHKLKAAEADFDSVVSYLELYSQNTLRKGLLMHDEMERHYLQPLCHKIEKGVSGPSYKKFVRSKSRAVQEFETATRRFDSFHIDLPEIPQLRVNASELRDPMLKYCANVAKEKKLAATIAQSQGMAPEQPQLVERDTMNLKKWKTLAETRFYGGNEQLPKGKKMDGRQFTSRVGEVLDAFQPPEQMFVRKRKAQTAYMRDHLAEQW